MNLISIIKRSPIVFPLALSGAVALVAISEASYWQSVGALNELGEMGAARTSILALQQGLLDAESGQRGYLLSGRREALVPYGQALAAVDGSFNRLELYYGDNPAPREVLDQLRVLAAAKRQDLAAEIQVFDNLPGDRIREPVPGDIGREQMNAIRRLGSELMAHEARDVAATRAELYRTLMLGRVGVAALGVISVVALVLYLRQTGVLARQRHELKRLVQSERNRLEDEVRERTAQLTQLTQHLQTAREDERNRLARNLHDELGALLTSAKLDAARIRSRLAGAAPEALERLAHLVETLNSSIALGRRIIEDLRPSTLANLGLVPTLEILGREFAESASVTVHCSLARVRLEASAELVVYRLVQEATTNIAKYAQATQVWLTLGSHAGQARMTVRDNGVGFFTDTQPRSAHGLVGMRFRVEAEGGHLSVVSAPGEGTVITMTLPEAAPADAAPPEAGHAAGPA